MVSPVSRNFSHYQARILIDCVAATLDRYEVPFFGPLASSILDDE